LIPMMRRGKYEYGIAVSNTSFFIGNGDPGTPSNA